MNKDIYTEIVKHVDDLSDMRQLGLANKTWNTVCQQELKQYPVLRKLAEFFARAPLEYSNAACHILKYDNQESKYRDEADYISKLKTFVNQQMGDKQLYFDLPISKSVKYIICFFVFRLPTF